MTYDPKLIRDDEVVKRDGTNSLTDDWDVGDGRTVLLDEIQIRDTSGLSVSDTTGNVVAKITDEGNFSLKDGVGVSEFSSDTSLVQNSDTVIPTQKAIKTYVDTAIASLTLQKYTHTQATDSTTWVVIHNLGVQYVNVEVIDDLDEAMIPASIKFDSVNQLTITFSSPEQGFAVICG